MREQKFVGQFVMHLTCLRNAELEPILNFISKIDMRLASKILKIVIERTKILNKKWQFGFHTLFLFNLLNFFDKNIYSTHPTYVKLKY